MNPFPHSSRISASTDGSYAIRTVVYRSLIWTPNRQSRRASGPSPRIVSSPVVPPAPCPTPGGPTLHSVPVPFQEAAGTPSPWLHSPHGGVSVPPHVVAHAVTAALTPVNG